MSSLNIWNNSIIVCTASFFLCFFYNQTCYSKTTDYIFSTSNQLFVISSDYDLGGKTINCGDNSIFDFRGGSLYNGTLIFHNNLLTGNIKIKCSIQGTIKNKLINIVCFGADNRGKEDVTNIINDCLQVAKSSGANIYAPRGKYLLKSKICFNPSFKTCIPEDPNTYFDYYGITFSGDGGSTLFYGVTSEGSDTFNLYCVKNISFRDFEVTNDITNPLSKIGSNAISVVNGENIEFLNIKAFGADGVEYQYAFDGGKGFTVQSIYAKEISFVNCYAYNCPSGFLIQYDNNETTQISISNCTAEKCQEGLYLGWMSERRFGIKHCAIKVDLTVKNCMVGYREEFVEGVIGDIKVRNTEKVNKLIKNIEGRYWLNYKGLSEIRQSSYAFFLYGTNNSQIIGSVEAPQLNNVLILDNYDADGKIANGNCVISISVNPNLSISKRTDRNEVKRGDFKEEKISINTGHNHLLIKNSMISLRGFNPQDIPQSLIKKGRNNTVTLDDIILVNE